MEKVRTNRLERFLCSAFTVLAVIMFAVLFWNGLHLTGQNTPANEYISFREDSVIGNLFMVFAALIGLCFFGKIAEKGKGRKARNIALGIVCTLTAAMSFYWVSVCTTAPEADQMMICQYANAFNFGDFGGLKKGAYIARYPQQLGMVTLLRGIFALFGESNYQAFRYFMAALTPLIVLSGCKIVRLLSEENAKAEYFYLFFMLTCFPMYVYTTFVYGDLISTALGLVGVWMYLAYLKKFSWIRLIVFGLSMGAAVQLRANLIILAVAMAVVLAIKLLAEWKMNISLLRRNIAAAASLVLGIVLTYTVLWGSYGSVMEEKAPSIPPLLFVAMGLNDAEAGPGWYNGYNYIVFAESGDDVQAANRIAWERIQEVFGRYREEPGYMLDFYKRKMNAQWNVPMYQCIAMNRNIIEPPKSDLAADILNYGSTARRMEIWMKGYQLLMYGSILFLLTAGRKGFLKIENYVLLIAVFGGFLFSMMWEAKTRYVLPFLFFQIPYMALGVSRIADLPGKLWAGRKEIRQKIAESKAAAYCRKNWRFLTAGMFILGLHMALLLFFGLQKNGFHEEEYRSYRVSAGHTAYELLHSDKELSGYDVQKQFLVTDGNRFGYRAVAEAVKAERRLPLYYLALNSLMSLAPNSFYKWFGIGLNAICSLGLCCGIIALILSLDRSRYRYLLACIAGLACAASPVMLGNGMFTGAYAMSGMWIVLYALLLVRGLSGSRWSKRKFIRYAAVCVMVCFAAFLVHPWCVAAICLLVLGAGIWTAVRGDALSGVLVQGCAVIAAAGLAFFACPAGFGHMVQAPGEAFSGGTRILGAVAIPAAVYGAGKAMVQILRNKTGGKEKRMLGFLAAAVLICGMACIFLGRVDFLYRDQKSKLEFARENAGQPALILYEDVPEDLSWCFSDEIWPYEHVLYADYQSGESVLKSEALGLAQELIVYTNCPEDMLQRIIESSNHLHSCSLVREDALFRVYKVE